MGWSAGLLWDIKAAVAHQFTTTPLLCHLLQHWCLWRCEHCVQTLAGCFKKRSSVLLWLCAENQGPRQHQHHLVGGQRGKLGTELARSLETASVLRFGYQQKPLPMAGTHECPCCICLWGDQPRLDHVHLHAHLLPHTACCGSASLLLGHGQVMDWVCRASGHSSLLPHAHQVTHTPLPNAAGGSPNGPWSWATLPAAPLLQKNPFLGTWPAVWNSLCVIFCQLQIIEKGLHKVLIVSQNRLFSHPSSY